MSSRRTLVILGVVTAVLAALLIVDVIRSSPPVQTSRRLFPELALAEPTAVAGPGWTLSRAPQGWRLVEPAAAVADPGRVADLVGTLQLLSWRRRLAGRGQDAALGLETPSFHITVNAQGREGRLAFGKLAGDGKSRWVARGGDAFAVPAYAAAALSVGVDALRSRAPFAAASGADPLILRIADRWLAIAGTPPRLQLEGGEVRADPDAVRALREALRELRVHRFEPATAADGMRIEVGASASAWLQVGGGCEGGVLAATSVGEGCVAAGELEMIRAAAEEAALVDRHLAPAGSIVAITQSRGARQLRAPLPDVEATQAARRWLEELRAATTGALEDAAGEVVATTRFELADGRAAELSLLRSAEGVVLRRDEEPLALVATDAALPLMTPSAGRFRSLELVAAEPAEVAEIHALSGGRSRAHWRRGEVLEDWRDGDGRRVPLERVRPVIRAVAPLRGLRAEQDRRRGDVTLVVTYAGLLAGAETREVTMELALGGASCAVRLRGDDVAFRLDDDRCRALRGLLAPGR